MRRAVIGILGVDACAVAAAFLLSALTGKNHFGEGRFITFLSGLQLLAVAGIAMQILRVRCRAEPGCLTRHPALVWGLIAAGFVFLAADEVLKIHEGLDELIHDLFDLEETGLTDRIDDLIVGLYGVIGLGVLFAHRRELLLHRVAVPWLVTGFVFMFAMVALDALTNRPDVLTTLVAEEAAESLQHWLGMVEDAFKIFAEGFFLLGFLTALRVARD